MGKGELTTASSLYSLSTFLPPFPRLFGAMPHQCNQANCSMENSISFASQDNCLPCKTQTLPGMLLVQEEARQAGMQPGHPSQLFMPPRGRTSWHHTGMCCSRHCHICREVAVQSEKGPGSLSSSCASRLPAVQVCSPHLFPQGPGRTAQ